MALRPKLLLVEDDENDRAIFRISTRDFNLELIEAQSGEKAIEILSQCKDIEIVVLDENLGGGMSGLETFRRIHGMADRPKVSFLTGSAGRFVDQISEIGFAPAVGKPMGEHGRQILAEMLEYLGIERKGEQAQ